MRLTLISIGVFLLLLPGAMAEGSVDTMQEGAVELKSAGPLAFGPDGVLFVGDSTAATIWAIDTGDSAPAAAKPINLSGVDAKLAALLGVERDQILVNDLAVNPISHKAYLAVSRGRGPDAESVIVSVDSQGALQVLSLDKIRRAMAGLPNAPGPDDKDRRGRSRRQEAITDLAYVDGRLIVAGLSNEEFASTLRSIEFPFSGVDGGTSVEIFHGAHGRWETNAPVRTFVPFEIQAEPHILAAYTCTPLVSFPLSKLTTGTKVVGTTLAELGNRNRPLDMVVYKKDGKQYVLMANSSRGVMKIQADGLESFQGITERTDIAGVPYETISDLEGVQQLDGLDDKHALLLVQSEEGALDLKTVVFP